MIKLRIGLDIGQKRDPTAISVVLAELREGLGRREVHFTARYLDRLPIGTPYPAVAERLLEVATRSHEFAGASPWIYVNATGVGSPVMDTLASTKPPGRLLPVYFNHGDQRRVERQTAIEKVILGKAFLVSRLQVLLQERRLHLPQTSEAEVLAAELQDYEIRIEPKANETYGAFRVGTHDDLVNALGLAVQVDSEKVTFSGARMRPPGL